MAEQYALRIPAKLEGMDLARNQMSISGKGSKRI